MGNREIFNRIITERKTKSSNKKPKYGMRKLTVGVVSCLLGYMMFFTPNVSQAEKVKETPQVASEVVAPLSETNTVEVNNPEVSNKNEEAEVTAKPATEEKVIAAEATQERKQSEDFNAEIKEIEVEKNGVVNYKEAITNLPADADVKPSAEIDTSKIEKHTISVDINFADGSTTTVNITINVIEKANADKPNDLELGEKIGSDQSVKAPADNIVEPDPSIPFGKTKARVEIEKKGINGGKFPFDTIFESGTTKVTLVTVDENGDDVETTATINATTGEMTFNNIVDMQAVKDGDVFIEFNGEKIKGKFIDSYEGPDYGQGGATNITTFKLILNQIRNTDVVVNTKDKSGNVVDNPTTEVTNGKIKKGDTEVDIPKKDNVIEIDDIKGLSSEEIDDFNNNTPEYSVKGTENGFLVNKDGNKVYKPGEFKIDEKGLDPTELEFTEKPLVTDKDQTGDTDYVTVTFESGEHGTISGSTIYYVIKGVDIGNNLSAPNVTGKDGWSYKGWNAELKNKYESNTKYSAIYEKKTTEAIPGKVKYVADDSLDFEEKKVEKAPVDGEKEVTTVSETGKDDVVTENIITPAEDGVTKVGNKKVETKTNEDGSTTETTTIYDVDPDTGDLSNPTVTNEKTTKKTTEKVPGKVKYVADDSLDFEEKKVEKAPVDGEKEVTTVSETGKDDVVTENIITPAEDGVTKVGNKKVETKTNEDGSTTETTTIYDVDPDTGDLSNPTVTTKTTPAEEYLAIFNGNGGNPTTQKVTVKDGEVVSGVTEPTREGYKFVKWVKLGTDKEFDLSKPFSKDILGGEKSVIFSAVWEKVVSGDTTAPTIDAGNITAVEGQPIPPVMVDVDDVNAKVTVEDLPEGLKYNPETKQIEGTIPKAEDWGYKEEKTITATIKAVDEAGNESTKEITVTILRDTDGDGTPDVTDTDDDNDGVDDKTEKEKGTDPKDKDSKPSTTAESTDPTIPEKTGVKDPEKLTDREKEEVKNKIEEANKDKFPEGTKVDVDDKGNATITYPDESKDTIPAENLVFQYKHGDPEIDDRPELPISDIIEPTVPGKTDVGDKDNLTDKEKEEIKDKIEEANKDNFPEGTKVEVDDKGNVTITYPDESTDTIPADKVVEQKEEVDKSELQKEVDKADTTKESDKYKNADQDKKDAYDKAIEDAKKVLENKDATQEEVDKAKDAL
ncbi:Rib/alpha-like domain-containing protein, partial [Finegoldia magna]|uniref:Rib/alpha-like domain-containing protein n=1 Tax=Finegoldia magna TaxID=1260 RepID=UPI000B9F1BBD